MPRQPADIDAEQVRKLASFGCTYEEIGAWFGVTGKTIFNRFSKEKQQGEENGKMSLRRRQFKRAMEGSDTMLIHLGKHRLGQKDSVDVGINTTTQTLRDFLDDDDPDRSLASEPETTKEIGPPR